MTPYRSPEDLAREHGRIIDGPADANGNGKSRLDGDHGADTANSVRPFDLTNWNPWDRTGGTMFPLDVMPGVVGDWIAERAMLTGADVSAFAMAALHIVSGCVDHRVRLQPKQYELDFQIGPAVWTMLIGPSSTLKTAVNRTVTDLLRRFDRQDANARDEIVRQGRSGGNDKAEEETPPARRRLITDATVEVVAEILSRQDCGTSLVRDELAGWFNGMDRYGNRGAERPFWPEAQNGGTYIVDRIKGQRLVNVLSVSVLGGVQPGKVKDLDSLTSDGFMQRFGVVNVEHAGDESDEPVHPKVRQAFDALAADIGRLVPTVFTFEPDAASLYVSFSNDMRRASHTIIPNEAFGTFLGKQARTVGTMALLLHVIDNALSNNVGSTSPIPAATFLRAQRIVDEFTLPHAEMFYASTTPGMDKVLSIAGGILKTVNSGTTKLTARELARTSGVVREMHSDLGKIRLALTPFVVNGWVTPESLMPNNTTWMIHPGLAGRFARELKKQVDAHKQLQERIRKTARTTNVTDDNRNGKSG